MDSAGDLQLCAGQKSGCETAVHAMSEIFAEEETDAVLLVDATNAFNSINRKVMLHNIQYIFILSRNGCLYVQLLCNIFEIVRARW